VHLLHSLCRQTSIDKEYCNQYTGGLGGRHSTNLAIYPFMLQVKRNLFHAADLEVIIPDDNYVSNMGKVEPKLGIDRSFGSVLENAMLKQRTMPKDQRPPEVLFTLYSGHDTVIAPVLAALGIFDHSCTWPPYASRIAFELWKSNLKLAGNLEQNNSIYDYYVRVVFNGKDVTRFIPSCIAARERLESNRKKDKAEEAISADHRLLQDGLTPITHVHFEKGARREINYRESLDSTHICSLSAFAEQIDGLLGGAASMTEACRRTNA
jgi:hypothetical protein